MFFQTNILTKFHEDSMENEASVEYTSFFYDLT